MKIIYGFILLSFSPVLSTLAVPEQEGQWSHQNKVIAASCVLAPITALAAYKYPRALFGIYAGLFSAAGLYAYSIIKSQRDAKVMAYKVLELEKLTGRDKELVDALREETAEKEKIMTRMIPSLALFVGPCCGLLAHAYAKDLT